MIYYYRIRRSAQPTSTWRCGFTATTDSSSTRVCTGSGCTVNSRDSRDPRDPTIIILNPRQLKTKQNNLLIPKATALLQ